MSFHRQLEETQNLLNTNNVSSRKKSLDSLFNLLQNPQVLESLDDSQPFSWNELLEDVQSCLKKECDRYAEICSKKGVPKTRDKNLDGCLDVLIATVKKGLREGQCRLDISRLVRYIDGCLREKSMRMLCRDSFVNLIKECILPNRNCLGFFEPEDFELLFMLLQRELDKLAPQDSITIKLYNCFSMVIKAGPYGSFPASFLRGQFEFMSSLCQKVTPMDLRTLQEEAVDIGLSFMEHTAEDNRLSCVKLGEELFSSFLNLYMASGHDSTLKLNFLKFALLLLYLHHPNGCTKSDAKAAAYSWYNWKMCMKKIYLLLGKEISNYMRLCVKNVMFFVPQGQSTVIVDCFVLLFVEVSKQLLTDDEPLNCTADQIVDQDVQAAKRRRVEASMDAFVQELQDTKSWVWVKLIGALLQKYPDLIDKRLYQKLLQTLHTMQLELQDQNSLSYIYEAQSILINIENKLGPGLEADILSLWTLVGDSTLRAAGLNQNVKQTQNLLQQLINKNIVNLDAVIQTYTSGVLMIANDHLATLEKINFALLTTGKKEELICCLLNVQNVRDFECLLHENYADVLVGLTLKQSPHFNSYPEQTQLTMYENISQLYGGCFELTATQPAKLSTTERSYNFDRASLVLLEEKLQIFVQASIEERPDSLFCLIGFLYNVLSSMVNFQTMLLKDVEQSPLFLLLNQLLSRDKNLSRFETHNEKTLKKLLQIVGVLDRIFTIRNSVTGLVKGCFGAEFLRSWVKVLNFFQEAKRADFEHQIKKSLIEMLAKYCLVSTTNITTIQKQILCALTEPNYDFKTHTDYDLCMSIMKQTHLAPPGYLPADILDNILSCLHSLCEEKFRNPHCASDITAILKQLLPLLTNEHKQTATNLLLPFIGRTAYYGPQVGLNLLDCIDVDPNSLWNGREGVKYVPEFLASPHQRVRWRAIKVLVKFLRSSQCQEVFELIYVHNLQVFEVGGTLTEQRQQDEILSRATTAIYTYVSIIANCDIWMEDSLFALIRLERDKKLFHICQGGLIRGAIKDLQQQFGDNFLDSHVENILTRWIDMGFDVNEFQCILLGCADKMELYRRYFDVCLPILLRKDRADLFAAAKGMGMDETAVFERCCTKIFAKCLTTAPKPLNTNFLSKTPEISYLAQILGTRFKPNLLENISLLILSLVGAVADHHLIHQTLGEFVVFNTRGISFGDFKKCLTFVEEFLCDGLSLMKYLIGGKMHQVQRILLSLQEKVYEGKADVQIKKFHHYTIVVDMALMDGPLMVFLIRDTLYFLVHLLENVTNEKLGRCVAKYLLNYLKKILPHYVKEFEQFLRFLVNSLKNLAMECGYNMSPHCLQILDFLIVQHRDLLQHSIKTLDAFPPNNNFSAIRQVHHELKYSTPLQLEQEIHSFLSTTIRQDTLIHLKQLLSQHKPQLQSMYVELDRMRGFSEDCQQSLLHKLTATLIKLSCQQQEEAIKCLGELGPANLRTLVLEPEKVLNVQCTSFELLTGSVVSLLSTYIVHGDIKVAKSASEALFVILGYKEGKRVVDSKVDYGHGLINKTFILPYLRSSVNSSTVKINVDDVELAWSDEVLTHETWITRLVVSLLGCFSDGCYLRHLVTVCTVHAEFSEHILPLIIHLMLSLGRQRVAETLSRYFNGFFLLHWTNTVTSSTDKDLVCLNKKSLKCMLDVINFIRQQGNKLELNYLYIAKAAAFCSAHFSALLYTELWCHQTISELDTKSQEFDTVLDCIYDNVPQEVSVSLQQILQSAYKSIGDQDALSGCGVSLLLNPEHRVQYHKNLGQWGQVMNYYCMQPLQLNRASLIESFKMNHLHQLPLLCHDEVQYECLWRLGQWDLPKQATEGDSYDKCHFNALKSLCDGDSYGFAIYKQQMELTLIDRLRHTSIESSRNLYPIFSQLQQLVEMQDLMDLTIDQVMVKWRQQDEIIRSNDFQFVEPIVAQRMSVLREFCKRRPELRGGFCEVVLDFVDYSMEEGCLRVAESAMGDLRRMGCLEGVVQQKVQFREAQLAWLNDDKMIAQHLLKRLIKVPGVSTSLEAKCHKLQGEYLAETYSDRNSILSNFYASIETYKNKKPSSTDFAIMEDTWDKIATYADREYQQIMSHINSDLFQKKLSNIKSCKGIAMSLNTQKKKTDDERKAQIITEKQIKIDETEVNNTLKDKGVVLEIAMQFYLKNLSRTDTNNIKIFRLMSLFLENRDHKPLLDLLKKQQIPSYKFITMLPQLTPHITNNANDVFGQLINNIIEKCAVDHPHHTLPLILALVNANKDREYNSKTSTNERSVTAASFMKKLTKHAQLNALINKMTQLSEALIELAYYVGDPKKSKVDMPGRLKIHKMKNMDDVLVPTLTLPVSKSNKYNVAGIHEFSSSYKTVGGINAPKRIECVCTRGNRHSQLVKGQDDLRQDAVMQQVFCIMNSLLASNKQTKNLLIRTYKVVPLSMRSGILEWVDNSMPIGDYLCGDKDRIYEGAHKEFRPQDCSPNESRIKFKNCAGKSTEEKLKVYNSICKTFQPVFHKFFETHFKQPSVWYERKRAYIHSVATTSMCGYILGIGDRHASNILIDKTTAEVIHIDFGIAFEQGKCLPTPETVPFRLSRDIVDGMGVSGIEGLFRKSCEKTMHVLRTNTQTVLTILEVLLYDPLYFWTVSASEANKRQTEDFVYGGVSDEADDENKNVSAQRALLRLRSKLQGTEEGKPSSVEQQVGALIQQAVDPVNLCRLFNGWQPFL